MTETIAQLPIERTDNDPFSTVWVAHGAHLGFLPAGFPAPAYFAVPITTMSDAPQRAPSTQKILGLFEPYCADVALFVVEGDVETLGEELLELAQKDVRDHAQQGTVRLYAVWNVGNGLAVLGGMDQTMAYKDERDGRGGAEIAALSVRKLAKQYGVKALFVDQQVSAVSFARPEFATAKEYVAFRSYVKQTKAVVRPAAAVARPKL